MKRVFIYVEGPSDKAVLETLLAGLIESKWSEQVFIQVQDAGGGDRKTRLLEHWPSKVADRICGEADYYAILMPDLYPKNKGFPHVSFQEMRDGI